MLGRGGVPMQEVPMQEVPARWGVPMQRVPMQGVPTRGVPTQGVRRWFPQPADLLLGASGTTQESPKR